MKSVSTMLFPILVVVAMVQAQPAILAQTQVDDATLLQDTGSLVVPPICSYSLTASSFTTGARATTSSVGVATPLFCGWTAASNVSWLTVISGGGDGNGTVTFAAAANSGGIRIGTLTIAGLT